MKIGPLKKMMTFTPVMNRDLQNYVNDLQAKKERLIGWTEEYETRLLIAKELLVRRVHAASLPGDWNEDSSLEKWFPLTALDVDRMNNVIRALSRELEKYNGQK